MSKAPTAQSAAKPMSLKTPDRCGTMVSVALGSPAKSLTFSGFNSLNTQQLAKSSQVPTSPWQRNALQRGSRGPPRSRDDTRRNAPGSVSGAPGHAPGGEGAEEGAAASPGPSRRHSREGGEEADSRQLGGLTKIVRSLSEPGAAGTCRL